MTDPSRPSGRRGSLLPLLVLAVALLALGAPLVEWLIQNGGRLGLQRPDAISFCNVLFVGNLLAGLVVLLRRGPRRILAGVGSLRGGDRQRLCFSVLAAAAIPTLLFTALQTTMVANVVLLGRRLLQRLDVTTFVFARNLFSAVVFFGIAVRLYGWHHFADAFAPELWVVMTAYAVVAIVLGQLAWYRVLHALPPPTIANASMASPLFALFFAWVLLGEVPGAGQWIALGIILLGMVVTRWKRLAERVAAMEQSLAGS